ncbi:MAG: hypothetical protein A4E37_00351 [Methanoregulaceae archaeon PtaB.Bin056]|jgi:hypothetical protein|nr:MAG: hypothetical protein A4E37_00351 [Methanoregulaceae archaeon PtaB.Bin056]
MREMIRIMMTGTIFRNADPRKRESSDRGIFSPSTFTNFPILDAMSLPIHCTTRQHLPGLTGVMESS